MTKETELYWKIDALESRCSKLEREIGQIKNKLRELCRNQGLFY